MNWFRLWIETPERMEQKGIGMKEDKKEIDLVQGKQSLSKDIK